MIVLPPAIRIFLCTQPTDLRRGFDGLAAMTRAVIQQNPLSGNLFVFKNRRGDRLKVLYWDRSGWTLVYKRLERGTFVFPKEASSAVEVDAGELAMILEGIDLRRAKRAPRYHLPIPA